MKRIYFIQFFLIFIFVSPLFTSGLVLYRVETVEDGRGDWRFDDDEKLPDDNYLDSVDIDEIGYKADTSSGMLTLSASFYGDRVDDGSYQVQYRFSLDLTNLISLDIDCLELLQTNADEFSSCKVSFWEQSTQNNSNYRYYSRDTSYNFSWEGRGLSWSFNLGEILHNESKTQESLGDIFSKPGAKYPFDTSEVRLPLLDVSMAVSHGSSDLIRDTLHRSQKDTSSAALFVADTWIYGVILLILGGILVIKRETIASLFRKH